MRALRSLIAASALLASVPAFGQSGIQYFPQTIPSGTFVGRLSSGPGPTEAISTTALLNALFPNGSAAFPFNAASVAFQGSVNGTVTVQAQAAAGTWTLKWPTSQGTTNQCLKTTASGAIATTSWANCAYLDANNTWSGTQTFNGNLTVPSLANFTGTFQWHGTTQTFPASGVIVGTSDSQTLTNKSIDAGQLTGTINAGRMPAGFEANGLTSQTSNYTATSADCGNPVLLGGNALFTITVNAASTYNLNCHLTLINIDSYSGAGSGRGKIMAVNGMTQHVLYPGQKLDLRRNGTAWTSDQQLAGSFGQVWQAASAVNFFIDTGGSDSNNDGLASGASGAFASLSKCSTQAYNVVYTRNVGSVFCSVTAAQNISSFVQVFYPMNGGGTLIFNSATPGSQWTWTCPVSSYCLQFGDGALVGITDTKFTTNPSSLAVITGHNHGVLDLNTNVSFATNSGQPLMTCDFDTHFNINNGFTYSNAASFLFNGCQGSRWNINNAINTSGSVTLSRLFNFTAGSLASFAGNVTWGTSGLSTSAGLVSGNSVLNNASGALPGGAPTPTTGGQYCTSSC